MDNPTEQTQTGTQEAATGHEAIGFMSPEINLLILTWVTFIAVIFILKKYAWKPILDQLDAREESIRKAVDEAEQIKKELANIQESRTGIIKEAENKARDLIDQSRKAAIEAARIITEKAQSESRIISENTIREIHDEKEKALSELKVVSADIAIKLASKLIDENLDDEKNRKLVNQFIKEI